MRFVRALFCETWLSENIQISIVTLVGFHSVCVDRTCSESGKKKEGESLCICAITGTTLKTLLRNNVQPGYPYYLPGKFFQAIIVVVYISPHCRRIAGC